MTTTEIGTTHSGTTENLLGEIMDILGVNLDDPIPYVLVDTSIHDLEKRRENLRK